MTSSASVAGAPSRPSRVSATTSAMAPQPIRPARKAATATSLPAFSQAGARPPARPACSARVEAGEDVAVGRLEVEAAHSDAQSMAPKGCARRWG